MAAPIDRPYVQAGFGTPGPQNRWTVFFRLILLVPQFFVAFAYGVAAFVLVVLGWFAALVTGRMPASFAGFLASFIQYYTRLTAYLYLMHDAYPPFSLNPARDYPVNLEIGIAPVRRLAVLFRIILLVPAFIVFNVVISGVQVAAFFIWLIVLVAGRMPVSLFEAESAVLRYGARYNAYAMMLTGKYPGELYGDVAGVTTLAPPWPPPTAPPPSTPLGTPVPPMPEAWLPPTTTPSPAPQEPAGEPGPTGSSWPPPAVPAAAVPPPAAALPPAAPAWPSAPLPPPMGPPTTARLTLSKAGKRIVTLFIVLGALSAMAQRAIVTTRLSSTTAYNSLTSLNDDLQSSLNTAQSDRAACTDSQLQCVEQFQTEVATAFTAFGQGLGTITFPSSSSTQVAALKGDTVALVAALRQLATSPDDSTYSAGLPHLQDLATQWDSDLNALASSLA